MIQRGTCLIATSVLLLIPLTAGAEVHTAVGHSEDGSTAFKFDGAPPPSKSDAAAKAKITLVDGRRDPAGGDVAVLNDGVIPRGQDEPRSNFFFAAGTDGGRISIDLGAAIDVKQVNTYSWHGDTRAPQVYRLYGSDGTSGDFNPQPKRETDPEKVGWKKLASVDTRPKEGKPGGQYGVSVSDPAGTLGKFRYLLLDVSPTENDDAFGNTFISEIDVVDAAATDVPVAAAPAGNPNRPGGGRNLFNRDGPMDPNGPAPVVAKTATGQEIVFDYSAAPQLKDWVENKLRPVCVEWYPKIVAMLPSDKYEAPKRFTIAFSPDYRGVAATGGSRVVCSTAWFERNLQGEAAGAVVHEMVHVVQQYRRAQGGNRNPGWLVEGSADWIRWFNYEPKSARPHPRAERANYNDSYRTTGHFLDYVAKKYDKDLVRKLNAAMREGKYSDELWKQITGKTVEELGQEWKATLSKA